MTEAQKQHNLKLHQQRIDKCEQALKLYETGDYSITELSKMFKTDLKSLSDFIKSKGLIVINKQNIIRFNEKIFDKINNQDKAYWLGFLYADGAVNSKSNQIELSLALKDENHLEKFKSFLNYTGNVRKDSYRCRLQISSKYFKNRLIELGCVPRKSLILTFPDRSIVSDKFLFAFIRGYFDGDGSIYIPKEHKKSKSHISLLGTKEFLQEMQNRSQWKENKLLQRNGSDKNTFSVSYGGKHILYMLESMYKNATIYLDRKHKKYKEYRLLYK